MNKADRLLERLQGQQPVLDGAEELADDECVSGVV